MEVSMTSHSIPWSELDEGIVDRVRLCDDLGFEPTHSCDGHGKRFPWVGVRVDALRDIAFELTRNDDPPFRVYRVLYVEEDKEATIIEWPISITSIMTDMPAIS